MQQTPSFLPIPSAGHGPKPGINRQGSFGNGLDPGPSRWSDNSMGSVSGMTIMPMAR